MLTCWPRFSICRNDLGNQAEIKDISTLRPAPSTEFRGGYCCGSQIGWGGHIFKAKPVICSCGCLKMSCNASCQNFANMGSPANLAITVRTASKFCARSRSQRENIFNLEPISWVISGIWEPWPECYCAFGDPQLLKITFKCFECHNLFSSKLPGRMHLRLI